MVPENCVLFSWRGEGFSNAISAGESKNFESPFDLYGCFRYFDEKLL